MAKKWLTGILFAAGFIVIAGCGQKEENETLAEVEQNQQQQDNETQEDKEEQQDFHQGSDKEDADGFDENLGQPGDDSSSSDLIVYQWEEITISIPDIWEGKYQIEEGEDGFSLIQSASAKKEEGMGFLCGFYRTDRMITDLPAAAALAYGNGLLYYMEQPTDVCYFTEDAEIAKEYHEMQEWINDIAATVSIDKEGIKYNPEEFVCPLSDTVPLKDDELLNLSDNQLAIARNEIYARHGRKFKDSNLASYFESCSWYEGSISPEEFDEAVLNQTEKDNLEVIKNAEKAYAQEHANPEE
ncbi:MAG: YARHG domain-containing protein [Lachnospiraceae bacterium]|nr:YARHG domain-containing protein [Lachnospiraceae bacterium]